MREKSIEKHLKDEAEKLGGKAFKFSSPGNAGVPDRIVIISGRVWFVELKRPGKDLRPIQKFRKNQFDKLGIKVWVLDSLEKVDDFIEVCTSQLSGRS
jgi:hypothetical protein